MKKMIPVLISVLAVFSIGVQAATAVTNEQDPCGTESGYQFAVESLHQIGMKGSMKGDIRNAYFNSLILNEAYVAQLQAKESELEAARTVDPVVRKTLLVKANKLKELAQQLCDSRD